MQILLCRKRPKLWGFDIIDFTAAPIFMKGKTSGAHQWLIEFDSQPENMERFTSLLDETLREVNSDYDAKRYKNLTMRLPEIVKRNPSCFTTGCLKIKNWEDNTRFHVYLITGI